MTTPPRKRRPRGSIDADLILRGAFELARRDGLDALSMPALATHLGTGVTSIYWYFRSKDDLLRRMFAEAAAEDLRRSLDPQRYSAEGWRDFLREQAIHSRDWYREDEVFADLIFTRRLEYDRETYEMLLARIESTLKLLMSAGFALQDAWHLFWDTALYTRGFVVTELTNRQSAPPTEGRGPLASLDVEALPLIAELAQNDRPVLNGTGDESFLFGLDLMLDAAQARLDAAANPAQG